MEAAHHANLEISIGGLHVVYASDVVTDCLSSYCHKLVYFKTCSNVADKSFFGEWFNMVAYMQCFG